MTGFWIFCSVIGGLLVIADIVSTVAWACTRKRLHDLAKMELLEINSKRESEAEKPSPCINSTCPVYQGNDRSGICLYCKNADDMGELPK